MEAKNLLFIMSDEHNRDFAGFAGHRRVQTPNLDRLAARGVSFRNAYTNCPICVPARASFATGRYVNDIGHWDNAHPYSGEPASWGHRLIEQGHDCVSIGKLHYRSEKDDTGFDEEILPLHVVDGLGDLLGLIRDDMPPRTGAASYAGEAGRGESTYTAYDRNIADASVRWIKDRAKQTGGKPWTLFVSFVCPHFPLIAPPEFYDLYDGAPNTPELYDPAQRSTHPFYREMRRVAAYDDYFDDEKRHKAVTAYMGLCTFLDHNIGLVLRALEEAGLMEETRVVYTSDHGENLGRRGFWGKSTMFEEAAAIPMIIAGPGVEKGQEVRTPVSLVDCHPTILQCVGVKPSPEDADLPGRSLFDIGAEADHDRTILSEYHASASPTGCFMIRRGKFKLHYFVGMEPLLFDLDSDPDELTDLAGEPEFSRVKASLEAELRKTCDPEEVDRRAKADQARKVDENGGRKVIQARGDFGYSPAPGQKPEFAR